MHWLMLIRWKNLAIVALTQSLVWYCLSTKDVRLSVGIFLLLCVSTLLITAAGNIINDIYDTGIDAINKPDRLLIDKKISKRQALWAYWGCNSVGLLLAIFAGYYQQKISLALIQADCILLLWLYSAYLKRSLLTGNLTVALLSAMAVIIIMLYQPVIVTPMSITPFAMGICYAVFAFIATWLRELVKDMEDAPGDAACGSRTLPVKYGIKVAGIWVFALVISIMLALGFAVVQLFLLHYFYLGGYIILLLVLPLSAWAVFFGKNNTPSHYNKAANWLKVIMLPGICSLIVYYLETQHLLCAR